MGNLTDDMTRLRGEVDALRSDRGALMQDLACGAKELASTVSAMQADFAAAHTAMARKTRKARAAYVARLKKQVGRMRKENASDLAGAARAWFGKAK
jgi:prenyltransferase beta subunit